MHYVNLGHTGLRVSRLCLGMMSYGKHESRPWTLDEPEAEPILRAAMEGGVNFYDTADVYNGGESEVLTGRLLGREADQARADRRVRRQPVQARHRLRGDRARRRGRRRARCPHRPGCTGMAAAPPGVTAPIIGATKLGHLQDALAAEQLSLSPEEIERLEEPYTPHPVAGHS